MYRKVIKSTRFPEMLNISKITIQAIFMNNHQFYSNLHNVHEKKVRTSEQCGFCMRVQGGANKICPQPAPLPYLNTYIFNKSIVT